MVVARDSVGFLFVNMKYAEVVPVLIMSDKILQYLMDQLQK
jgi:hypothetical protein